MPTPARHNRKAGTVILTTPQRARVLEHQCEAGAGADTLAEILFSVVKELVRAHKLAGRIEDEIVEANRLVCSAEYAPPAPSLEAVAS